MIKACSDRIPEHRDFELMARHATDERRDNRPDASLVSNVVNALSIAPPEAAVLLTSSRWANKRAIKIAFMDGSQQAKDTVKIMASWWLNDLNLRIDWVKNVGEADIRITFAPGGSWSYLGTQNLGIPQDQPTMQFGWLEEYDPSTPEGWQEFRRTVLHEFGHMFGYAHEHSSPVASIPWDKPAVYAYHARVDGWDAAQVDRQVFYKYSKTLTQYSEFDEDSIMEYPVPNELTIGNFEIGWNRDRSPVDKKYGRLWYPR